MNHLAQLIQLRGLFFKNSLGKLERRSRFEAILLTLFFLGAGAGLFFFFHQSFSFFKSQEPFGPILIDETFYLLNFALSLMLFISTAVSSYASLFRSPEVSFLVTRPVEWAEIYFLKLIESLCYSSWALLFIILPFMSAFGIHKNMNFLEFPLLCLAFYVPFVILTGTLGTLLATLTVWLFPSRTRRRAALALLIAIGIFLFVRVEPEVVKEQGSIAGIMSGYLPHIAFAKNPLLPSYWTTRGILELGHPFFGRAGAGWKEGLFYWLILVSNALFFLIPAYSVAARLYPRTFFKAQDHAESEPARRFHAGKNRIRWYDHLSWPSRPAMAFLEKDLKTFSRDPSEWSQLLIFFGILFLYFINLRNLQFHILKDFWKDLVFVLNTVGTYIVLSSFNMRFVFPMLSLEGTRSWMIGLTPIRFSSLLLEKFILGTVVSVLLTMPLVFLSGWMLAVPLSRILFATGLGFFVCIALTGLSVGLGTLFPNFKSNNPSEIISGFGGSLLLVTHLAYLTLIGIFLALTQESRWIIFGIMAGASLLIGMVPLKLGVNALKQMEF